MSQSTTSHFQQNLLSWYREQRRDLPWRQTSDPYSIWVSEVMLQQTQVATVIPYFNKWVTRYPDILTLAAAPLDDVLKGWEGLGYYARARNLHKAAAVVKSVHGGVIPKDYNSFRSLPGVGDYIAAAVTSIAWRHPVAAVDGNVKRVFARVECVDAVVNHASSSRVFQTIADDYLASDDPGDYNQALMELGAIVCRPRSPQCPQCPVSQLCAAFVDARVDEFPKRRPRKKVPHYQIAIGVVRKGDRLLITRRKEDGLLGGLWEFPGGKVEDGEAAADACRREIAEEVGVDVAQLNYLTSVDHAYTHFRISVDVFTCSYRAGDVILNGPTDFRWILVDELDDYPLPGANHKFLPALRQRLSQP